MIKTYKELIIEGCTDKKIKALLNDKKIIRIQKGYYSTTKEFNELEYIIKKYPNTIFTLESAYYYYGLTSIRPKQYYLATLHKAKVIKDEKIKQIFVKDNIFNIGKTNIKYQNININIYDKERLLIELLKNKNKYTGDFYDEIINNYKKILNELDTAKIYDYLGKLAYNEKIIEQLEKEIINNNKKIKTNIKGIVLAGGSGTRLYPITEGISKQLLPIYNKPMIYYPISVLMSAGIKDILIITTPEDQNQFKKLLKDGSQLGVKFEYAIQPTPDGLAQAFIIGEEFIGDNPCALVLGDNIFHGSGFDKMLEKAAKNAEKGYATNFGIEVPTPERFGVMEYIEENGEIKVLSIEEKPTNPKSDYAVTGLYFYPKGVSEYAKTLKPSKRNELEITDLNNIYLKNNKLRAELLKEGFLWYDTGNFDTLCDAISSVKSYEQNRGKLIACLEEISYVNEWITKEELNKRAILLEKNSYGNYLKTLIKIRRKK